MSVLAVPRSMAISLEMTPNRDENIPDSEGKRAGERARSSAEPSSKSALAPPQTQAPLSDPRLNGLEPGVPRPHREFKDYCKIDSPQRRQRHAHAREARCDPLPQGQPLGEQ